MNAAHFVRVGVLAISLFSCSTSGNNPDANPDAFGQSDVKAMMDSAVLGESSPDTNGAPSADASSIPEVLVDVVSPMHLRTNWVQETVVLQYTVPFAKLDAATAQAEVLSAFTLVVLPAMTQIQGSWKIEEASNATTATFTPSTALDPSLEHQVTLAETGHVVPSREHTLFRVGSLPRIVAVEFAPSPSTPTDVEHMLLRFSEGVSSASVASATTIKDSVANTLPATLTTSCTACADVLFKLPTGVAMTDTLDLVVTADVGAPTGQLLDGKYTGTAGSGTFAVSLVPQKHVASSPWVPSL